MGGIGSQDQVAASVGLVPTQCQNAGVAEKKRPETSSVAMISMLHCYISAIGFELYEQPIRKGLFVESGQFVSCMNLIINCFRKCVLNPPDKRSGSDLPILKPLRLAMPSCSCQPSLFTAYVDGCRACKPTENRFKCFATL